MKKIHYLTIPLVSAYLIGVSGATISAQEVLSSSSASDPNYWTADRILNAEPLDTPEPTASLTELLAAGKSIEGTLGKTSVAEDGAPPSTDLPDADFGEPIYALDETNNVLTEPAFDALPSDVGTGGSFFSSSRLIPIDARLTYPYLAAGKLFFTIPGQGDFICSGAVLRPRIVLTAGHCVHSGSNGANGFFTNFQFIPAYDRRP